MVLNEEDSLVSLPSTHGRWRILNFVDLDQVDPLYFDKSYYLEPGDERAANLTYCCYRLWEATGKIAIARVVIRTKEDLAAVPVSRTGSW